MLSPPHPAVREGMGQHLLRVLEASPELRVRLLGCLLRVASHRLDVDLQAALQQLVHLPVVVVIVAGGERRVHYSRHNPCPFADLGAFPDPN